MIISIAASDANQKSKTKADFMCTGVDDQEQIEAAINSLSASGQIQLSDGTFWLSDTLVLDTKPISIVGCGPLATKLFFDLPTPGDGLVAGDLNGRGIILRNFQIDGNLTNGLKVSEHAAYCVFDNLHIYNAEVGVYAMTNTSQNLYRNLLVKNCTSHGFKAFGVADNYISCKATRSQLGGVAGFHVHDSGSTYSGCIVDKWADGVYIAGYAKGVSFHGLHLERCGSGIRIQASEPDQPRGISITGGLICNSQSDTEAAVHVGRSESVVIQGVMVSNSASEVNFWVADSAQDCLLIANHENHYNTTGDLWQPNPNTSDQHGKS